MASKSYPGVSSRVILAIVFSLALLQGCDNSVAYDPAASRFSVQDDHDRKIMLPDSAVYEGEYRDGLFHGKGTMVWRNGMVYEGEFARGMMHGRGVIEFASGERYEGDFANGLLEGSGKLVTVKGDIYEGEFAADHYHGKGRFVQSGGDTYEGDFLKGQLTGEGRISYAKQGDYEGGVRNWEMHGQGTYTSKSDGTVYSGTFRNGSMSGHGQVATRDGDRYSGNVENWRAEGQGEMQRKDGEHYVGEFKEGVYHGKGKITYKNRDSYEGEFEYGMRHGRGTLTRAEAKGHKKVQAGWWEYNYYRGEKKPVTNAAKGKGQEEKIDAEAIFYRQPELLARELGKLERTTPSMPDLYVINFAGYSNQDVFMKEARFAHKLFTDKFTTAGRTLSLINNHAVSGDTPLASVTNLERSIQHVATLMDRDEDILFLFLTSHGSKNELDVTMKGMPLNDLSASRLAGMLRESGIKWKVIVVSACYSGSFIDELKDDYTMILTASKADHVSFGCSDEADFTFFGRAFFKHALPGAGSFRQAFEEARGYVSKWEDEEKYDHSEPQIWTTTHIEQQLASWRKTVRLAARN